MAIVVTTAGETILLDRIFNRSTINNGLSVGLFKSNITPGKTTIIGPGVTDIIEIASNDNTTPYTKQVLGTATNASGIATFPQLTWSLSGGADPYDVYGYFVVDTTTGNLIWCERFPAKFTIAKQSDGGGQIKITLKMELE